MAGTDDTATKLEHDDASARLLVVADGIFERRELPETGKLTIGRSESADVRIVDTSVSREHAVLRLGAEIHVEDRGSANGTLLNNVRLSPRRKAKVAPGDVIRVGRAVLLVQRGARARPSGGPPSAADGTPDVDVSGLPIVVKSEKLRKLWQVIDLIAPGSINVLIQGETGTGKEVVARSIHARSPRARSPFLGLNCAAFTEGLLESELFGHEKGAFTGADRAKPGLLESAGGGTVFLDEIADMPLAVQTKLLRVLEERQVYRVGALAPRAIDVRFLAATNRDLESEVAHGRFRKDLFFRLNGVALLVPPLRERVAEVETLARQYVAHFAADLGRPAPDISAGALDALKRHSWPGNVREMRNTIERAVLLSAGATIEPPHLSLAATSLAPVARASAPPSLVDTQMLSALPQIEATDLRDEVASLERDRILQALESCAGNQTRAAKLLGISRRALVDRLDKLGLPRPRKGK